MSAELELVAFFPVFMVISHTGLSLNGKGSIMIFAKCVKGKKFKLTFKSFFRDKNEAL